jgi:orotate phosphoribosyltransferase
VKAQAESVLDLFRSTGAYLQGHFRLTSGLHSPVYLQCALVLQHPEAAEELGRMLAAELHSLAPEPAALVASPALGGLIIGHEVARALHARFIFTERDAATSKMTLRRGFHVTPGERAVVVEDVLTTGGSTRDVIEVLRAAGAEVLAAGSIIDPAECPLCHGGVPVVKPGSRPA